MSALGDLQRGLRDALMTGDCPAALITGGAGDTAQRFAIYAHAYRARLISALRDNYPVLWAVLGDEAFDTLASGYLATYPSRQASIRWFGAQLHEYVSAKPEHLPHPAIADLIRMEWALRAAFDAANELPLMPAALATLAPEDWPALRLRAHASVSLLQMGWAVEPLWHAIEQDPEGDTAAPEASPHALLIWRNGLETRFRTLDSPSAAFLTALIAGEPFAAACEACAAHLPDAGKSSEVVAGALQQFIQDGIFSAAPAF
ncbi:DNA-binding domain-containing protein [Niveibacterium sp. 24ML]|uniref:HvfC/BufC N-terminal domain-containing protein n=1 Tax=Niveibacterium sp. 24ML TaxID=2985512 RepID=UPI0022721B2F|nr:DNA-binding domain-containing protein [Niveibacterium sp. 24ML]MCX9156851.1 DNA-binding domain-containing protein [Niveibacterium sp. 24ML]